MSRAISFAVSCVKSHFFSVSCVLSLLGLQIWFTCLLSLYWTKHAASTEILMMLTKPWMKSMTIWRTWDKSRTYCRHRWEQWLISMMSLSLSPSFRTHAHVHAHILIFCFFLPWDPLLYCTFLGDPHACAFFACRNEWKNLNFPILNRMNWKLNLQTWRGRSWRQSFLRLPQPLLLLLLLQCVYLLLSSPLDPLPRVIKQKMMS
jgi:hypothetical protein